MQANKPNRLIQQHTDTWEHRAVSLRSSKQGGNTATMDGKDSSLPLTSLVNMKSKNPA